MKRLIGAGLFVAIAIAILVAIKLMLPSLQDEAQKTSSDASETKGQLRIDVDNWVGYFPLTSPEMKKALRRSGYNWVVNDDKADYATRMRRLKNGECDFAVATVDSYMLNSKDLDFPSVIIAVIDESKGGDAIVARKDNIKNLDDLKGRTDVRVAYTPDSPSHHLLKGTAINFAVPELLPKNQLKILANGSEDALKKLLSGGTDIAVLWEPDVSKALASPGTIKLLGTEDTEKFIVDVLLVHRNFARDHGDLVKLVLSNYFKILKRYRENEDKLSQDLQSATQLPSPAITSMLKGVKWVNLTENCQRWFGITPAGSYGEEGLITTIDSTLNILLENKDFTHNPIPKEDPYRLINSSFLSDLMHSDFAGFTSTPNPLQAGVNSLEAPFTVLSETQWERLQAIGSLEVKPIIFQSGTDHLDFQGKIELDKMTEKLAMYPNFRILIKGHTSTKGDALANKMLSKNRADAVARYLNITFSINGHRMRAMGCGGEEPLPMLTGESARSYAYRLSRVQISLVKEVF
jgi:outer membrane protein OmpA-like peptidoglycan-associated protein/ABC-type nitrate/sulfonate/bicarbonate transport system substrate-binding protein